MPKVSHIYRNLSSTQREEVGKGIVRLRARGNSSPWLKSGVSLPHIMTRLRGDLILYRSSGRWYERLITLATRGPFVHVALVVDPLTVIAARTQGISYEAMPPDDAMHTTISLTGRATPEGIEQGLAWATAQRGREYGWLDIVYQALKFLWPRNPFRFGVEGHYDCSDFACRYLIHAQVPLPDVMLDTYAISPNDLGRWAGLIGQPAFPTVTPRPISEKEKTS